MSVPAEFHSTLCRTYLTLCISVRQPITEVKAEWNFAADVWREIGDILSIHLVCDYRLIVTNEVYYFEIR